MITVDEWLKFCIELFIAKAATREAHPILDHGTVEEFKAFVNAVVLNDNPEYTEVYSFLFELFTKFDKDGLVSRESFSKLVDMAASIPRIYGYVSTDVELYMRRSKPGERRSTPWTSREQT